MVHAAVAAAVLALGLGTATPVRAHDSYAKLGTDIRRYLLENPEVLVEAIEVLSERQRATEEFDAAAWLSTRPDEVFRDGYSVVAGNPDGDLTLVEFYDYRCGYCRLAFDEVWAFLRDDGNIRLILKEFPILSEASVQAARAATAASAQDRGERYLAFHKALLMHEGSLDDAAILVLATASGLDATRIEQAMRSGVIADQLEQNRRTAARLGIQGTPAFVLGDEIARGYLDRTELAEWAAQLRSPSGQENH